MEGIHVVLIIALIAFVAIGGYLAWRSEQQRKQELAELAGRLGLRFDPRHDKDHDDRYRQFEVFRRGHSRVAYNTLSGALQLQGERWPMCCGDFRYKVTSSNGKSTTTTTYRFSYLIVRVPWPTPPLLIRPEGVFDKLKGMLGFDDIDFESDEFSRRFYVKSPDKRFAYDVLHPRMMEFLLAARPPMIDLEDEAICLSDGGRRWQPRQFEAQIDFLRQFCELWPRHLVKELKA